ncbi:calcium-activated chloride channel regulator 4A-like [Penaeus chinensis]|uniref:calcium-activated chloride channel regulator 4A-like n=1 Tax=Penaeus chinensis TaxID=139456 RepID=UPI001FB81B01|nr:calcium-activated chloride channel regulator 4A-like [Penaeus chinensis]
MFLPSAVTTLAIILLSVGVRPSEGHLELINNGYEDLVVAISPSVNESDAMDITEAIKRTASEASAVLFKATRQRAFFKDVKILLPMTWTSTAYDQIAFNQHYQSSEIRVDVSNAVYGDQPYTDQPGGCGDPGRYIHLTPDYLVSDEEAAWWGPRPKTLVHEWAKLRWGVFAEIGYPNDPTAPPFFWNSSGVNGAENVSPTYCANQELSGELRDALTNASCTYADGLPDANCRFIPNATQEASSSLMGYHHIKNIVEFCDSDSASNFSHDALAPSRHNLMCEGRSAWDVMGLHPDFDGGANPPAPSISPTKFTVLRQEVVKIALVLDYSSPCMGTSQRIQKLQRAVRRWILYEVPDGIHLGIIKFWGSALPIAQLTEITSQSRRNLASQIDTLLTDGTSIGAGLEKAINDVLKNQNNPVILVVSGSPENRYPFISDNLSKVVESGARVVTVALGNEAEIKLQTLASATGGKAFAVSDDDEGGALDEALLGALAYQPEDSLKDVQVKLHGSTRHTENETVTESFTVDASVGRKLEFRLDTDRAVAFSERPHLIRPNGTQINAITADGVLWIVSLPVAEVGLWAWSLTLAASKNCYIHVSVTAKGREPETLPILSRAWLNVGPYGVDIPSNPVIVYAEIKQGNSPVVDARVRATVTQPSEDLDAVELDLLDNGQGADTQAGDGVYSRYYTVYPGAGRYSVEVQVWGDDYTFVNNGSEKTNQQVLKTPTYCCGSVVPSVPQLGVSTGNFSRTASAGSFQVLAALPAGDLFPPSRVTDLQVSAVPLFLDLAWTAPGDDLDAGAVAGYVIRLSENRSDLVGDSFDAGGNETLLMTLEESANMTELFLEAGQKVTLNLTLEHELESNRTYFVGIRAVDDVGLVSAVSNHAVVVSLEYPSPATPPSSPPLPAWAIFLIVSASLVAVGMVAGGAVYARKKRKRTESDSFGPSARTSISYSA